MLKLATILLVGLVMFFNTSVVSAQGVTPSLITGKKIGEIAVSDRLDIELHSEFMVARNENDTVLNWYNLGFSGGGEFNRVGGNFGNFGLDVPWDQRDEFYPSFTRINDVPAVSFNGKNFLKSNIQAEAGTVGNNDFALELWVYNEKPNENEVILAWQSKDGKQSSAALTWPTKLVGSNKWHHLVVNVHSENEEWYLDGEKILTKDRELRIEPGHRMVLGGESEFNPSFTGSLAVVRLHRNPMSEEAIEHNYQGGVMLGTTLHPNIDPYVSRNDAFQYDAWSDDNPDDYFVAESDHFRFRISKERINQMSAGERNAFYARIPEMLDLAELSYKTYAEIHALRLPIVSTLPQYRGDGIKYKIVIFASDGSNWATLNGNIGFGYPAQGAGHINPHELVHATQMHTGGGLQGNYWEAHANWPQTYFGLYQTVPPALLLRDSMLFEATGRNYYHARLMMQHLAETPEYGPMFISKLWYDGNGEYPWIIFQRVDPDPSTSLGYEWARMVQRNVTWDYTIYGDNPNLYVQDATRDMDEMLRYGRVLLEEIPYEPDWYRPPKEMAPQQTGWNIVPLEFDSRQVKVELSGYINPERGSDWYAGFVAVDNDGKPRYSDIISTGETLTFDLLDNEVELYMTIAAIPSKVMAIDMTGDVRSPEQEQFVYKVRFEGAKPVDLLYKHYQELASRVSGRRHPNGGGFVASTATVDSTAYVGPNAIVLGRSKVLGNARVEDYAVVNNGTVRDNAVVSGRAIVTGNAIVQDNARVDGYARVWQNAVVKDNAQIYEHATHGDNKTASGNVTIKGVSSNYGNATGTAMLDGHYAKGNEITKGKWFSWSWGTGQNAGEIDAEFNGLYLQMTFEKDHPWMAWDDFGLTWGYLVNGAKASNGVLTLNGKDQFVELQKDVVNHQNLTLILNVKWHGGDNQHLFEFGRSEDNRMYLTPSNEDGVAEFVLINGNIVERLTADRPLAIDEWERVIIQFAGNTAKLFIGNDLVSANDSLKISALDRRGGVNYLGRGYGEDTHFHGEIDTFEVYKLALPIDEPWVERINKPFQLGIVPVGAEQNVSVGVVKKEGVPMAGTVQINYGDGWKEMTATQTTGNIVVYTYKWLVEEAGKIEYEIRATDFIGSPENTVIITGSFRAI
ncbi:MAG: hypothetical protein GX020_02245 [Firmicutes bacterium]|nr:hypothetical protein [Bacillota bacterium]